MCLVAELLLACVVASATQRSCPTTIATVINLQLAAVDAIELGQQHLHRSIAQLMEQFDAGKNALLS